MNNKIDTSKEAVDLAVDVLIGDFSEPAMEVSPGKFQCIASTSTLALAKALNAILVPNYQPVRKHIINGTWEWMRGHEAIDTYIKSTWQRKLWRH